MMMGVMVRSLIINKRYGKEKRKAKVYQDNRPTCQSIGGREKSDGDPTVRRVAEYV
jgi:hypothetical protein